MLISLYGSQVLEMGLFYSWVLKANPLMVKEIKVGEHLLLMNPMHMCHVCKCFVLRVVVWKWFNCWGFIMLDDCAKYHHQYGAFLCVRVQVQNLGEPAPVVTSFAKHPGYGHLFNSDEKFNVTVNPQFQQECISLP
jgi:hypothetical protein